MLEKIKVKYDTISWADLIQMGGALAVELAGGPVIDMVYGRKDCDENHSGYDVKVTKLWLYIVVHILYYMYVL